MYTIYAKRTMVMGGDGNDAKQYLAVKSQSLRTGLFRPSSHPEIERGEVGEVEAKTQEEAVAKFREKSGDSFM